MSAPPGAAALVATLVGVAGPLALAHWGRSPADRLRSLHTGAVALATGLAAIWGLYVLRPDRLADPPIPVTVFYGFLVGLWGLIAYGVLERLALPLLARLRRSD